MHAKSRIDIREHDLNVFLALLTSEASFRTQGEVRDELLSYLEGKLEQFQEPVVVELKPLKGKRGLIPTIWFSRLNARQMNYEAPSSPVVDSLATQIAELLRRGQI